MKNHEIVGRKIVDVGIGASFIELHLDNGEVWVVESTDKKSTKHQEKVDVELYREKDD